MFLLTLIIISCSDDGTKPENNQDPNKEIFPLKVGNEWNYKLNYYLKDTTIEITNKFTKDTSINNIKYYYLQADNEYMLLLSGIYSKDNKGTYKSFDGEFDNRYLFFPYPTTAGYNENLIENLKVKVINTNVSVVTPAGNFKCIQYSYTFYFDDGINFFEDVLYLAPGVGYVKSEHYDAKKEDYSDKKISCNNRIKKL